MSLCCGNGIQALLLSLIRCSTRHPCELPTLFDTVVIQTFRGTMSDVIYPEVKDWLDNQLAEDAAATV